METTARKSPHYRFKAKFTAPSEAVEIEYELDLPFNDQQLAEEILGQMADQILADVEYDAEMYPTTMVIAGGYQASVTVLAAMDRLTNGFYPGGGNDRFNNDCLLLDNFSELFDSFDYGDSASWSILGAELQRRYSNDDHIVANERGLFVEIEAK